MTMNHILQDSLSPTQQKGDYVSDIYENEIEWAIDGDCTEFAKISFDWKREFGDMVVTAAISDKPLTLKEVQEAIRDYFPAVQFEHQFTVKYK